MSTVMTTTANLDQLRELALPAPAVSYLPQTWGWLLVALGVLIGVAVWACWRWRHWQRDRYRREALARLDQLQRLLNAEPQQVCALRELPELLKRVAISMPGQPHVATLGGEQWQAFLQRTSDAPLPKDFSRRLATLAYAPQSQLRSLSASERDTLLALARVWVETHHVAV